MGRLYGGECDVEGCTNKEVGDCWESFSDNTMDEIEWIRVGPYAMVCPRHETVTIRRTGLGVRRPDGLHITEA